MDASITYTTESLGNMSPIYLDSLITIKIKANINSSLGSVWPSKMSSIPLGWQFSSGTFEKMRDSFIGMLNDDEAEIMKKEVALFKKRFNDDFARKHSVLFGK